MYPRLQTIAQLAETHVDALHTGAFVTRSVDRWRAFESRSSTNQRVSTGSGDANSSDNQHSTWIQKQRRRNVSEDAQRAIAAARTSSVLVIQSAWRRFLAVSIREKLAEAIWTRQLRVAAWISQRHDRLRTNQRLLDERGLRVLVELPPRSLVGLYYHLPATLLTLWLHFACATASSRFLRRSPAVLQTIDIHVHRTLHTAATYWRRLSVLAVTSIQCCVRAHWARTLFQRLRAEYRCVRATLRLQGFFRVCLARKLATQLRRHYASVTIQCFWWCVQARSRVRCQRIRNVSTKLWAVASRDAIGRAARVLMELAATSIQRVHRGLKARSQVRWLVSVQEQLKWLKNPSKAYKLFAKQQYGHAALCFEHCRRQGYVRDPRLCRVSNVALLRRGPAVSSRPIQRQHVTSGSRMSFSFSSAPVQLAPTDWFFREARASREEDSSDDSADTLQCLRFWFAYALSHFHTYDATGAPSSLERSRDGWERFLCVYETYVAGVDAALAELWVHARFHLLLCTFWMGGSDSERRDALTLSDQLIQEIDTFSQDDAQAVRAQLLMMSSMLAFDLSDASRSCERLEELLRVPASRSPRYTELEVRFVLAVMLCEQQKMKTSSRAAKRDAAAAALAHLRRCFQLIELSLGVGFYHGVLGKDQAKELLAAAPVGSYLLHTSAVALSPVSVAQGKRHHVSEDDKSQDIHLKVKLSDRPLRVTSLRIQVDTDRQYYSKKLPHSSRSPSLYDFVARLPPSVGVLVANGVRKKVLVDALANKLVRREGVGSDNPVGCDRILSWQDWERHVQQECTPHKHRTTHLRSNESWAALCLHVARALESSESYVFSLVVAKQALACSKDREVRVSANFVAARCAFHLQRRSAFESFMRLAELSNDASSTSERRERRSSSNLRAVHRALSTNATISRQEPFESQLERVQKLERMCVKAWRYDSLSVRSRGDPFSEALLLERIHTEMYTVCADTFFVRSRLKAHIRAFLGAGMRFEKLHLDKAVACVAQLLALSQATCGWEGSASTSQLEALTALTKHSTISSRVPSHITNSTPASRLRPLHVDQLLLIWHRFPFAVCFELAEALYHTSAASDGDSDSKTGDRVIDMYESLYGRLRGAKPASRTYAAFEELLLMRLAFLYAQKATAPNGASSRFLRTSIRLIDELLSLRAQQRGEERATRTHATAKRVTWPRALTLPRTLSHAELVFARGYFRELREDQRGTRRDQRKSWRDYDVLHTCLMATVTRASNADAEQQRSRERTRQPRGVRVFLGPTQDVVTQDVLHSNPIVSVQCEGKTSVSCTPPTWTSLSPSWNEYVEFDVASVKSRLVVSLVDRGRRGTDAHVLGSVQLYVSEVMAAPDAFGQGRFFALSTSSTAATGTSIAAAARELKRSPQLFLRFQVLFKALESSALERASVAKQQKRMCGNWALDDLRANLHGDLEVFVRSRWVWSSLGRLWLAEQEYAIASSFFRKAVAAQAFTAVDARKYRQRQQEGEAQPYVEDLLALVTCYHATLSRDRWVTVAASIVDTADAALQAAVSTGELSTTDIAVQKLVQRIESRKRELCDAADSVAEPFATAERCYTPASSNWAKLAGASSTLSDTVYFVNLDTGAYFRPCAGAVEPLEFEDKELLKRCSYEAVGQRPHRITVMSAAMRARVQLHSVHLEQRRVADSLQWTAVFDARRQEMRFFSETLLCEATSPSESNAPRTRVSHMQRQPATYVLLADSYMLYNVLVVQDAFRRFRARKHSWRRLRSVVQCVRWLVSELLAARQRIAWRVELTRKQMLNCLHVVVERAHHLQAGDVFTSDPFVLVTVRDHDDTEVAKGMTSVRHNTRNPTWNEEFHFPFDWTEFAGGRVVDKLDDVNRDDDSEADDEKKRRQLSVGTLSFQVLDYDFISLRRDGRRAGGGSEDDASEDGSGGDTRHDENVGDPLGHASVRIESLEHGATVVADLALTAGPSDHANDVAVDIARGTLTVSVQWIHARECGRAGLRRASTHIIEASKKPLAKRPLPTPLAAELRTVRSQFDTVVQLLSDLATTTLNPLQRLHKRMLNAQAVGKTADEAKVVEQRMLALITSHLTPKAMTLDEHMGVCRDAVLHFVHEQALLTLIHEYVDSQVTERGLELATVLRSALSGTTTAANEFEATVQEAEQATERNLDQTRLEGSFQRVFRCRQVLNVWRQSVETLATTFFVVDQDAWIPTPLQTHTDEIYATLEALQLMLSTSGPCRSARAGDGSNTIQPSLERPTSPPKTPAALAAEKRMERIQKEKRRRQPQSRADRKLPGKIRNDRDS